MKHNFTLDIITGGLAYYLFGKDEISFYVLIFLFFVNIILGIGKSIKEDSFELTFLRDGVVEFMAIILVLTTASVLAKLDGAVIHKLRELNPYLLSFFLLYCFVSILDNAIAVGVPFPKKVLEYIKQKFDELGR